MVAHQRRDCGADDGAGLPRQRHAKGLFGAGDGDGGGGRGGECYLGCDNTEVLVVGDVATTPPTARSRKTV